MVRATFSRVKGKDSRLPGVFTIQVVHARNIRPTRRILPQPFCEPRVYARLRTGWRTIDPQARITGRPFLPPKDAVPAGSQTPLEPSQWRQTRPATLADLRSAAEPPTRSSPSARPAAEAPRPGTKPTAASTLPIRAPWRRCATWTRRRRARPRAAGATPRTGARIVLQVWQEGLAYHAQIGRDTVVDLTPLLAPERARAIAAEPITIDAVVGAKAHDAVDARGGGGGLPGRPAAAPPSPRPAQPWSARVAYRPPPGARWQRRPPSTPCAAAPGAAAAGTDRRGTRGRDGRAGGGVAPLLRPLPRPGAASAGRRGRLLALGGPRDALPQHRGAAGARAGRAGCAACAIAAPLAAVATCLAAPLVLLHGACSAPGAFAAAGVVLLSDLATLRPLRSACARARSAGAFARGSRLSARRANAPAGRRTPPRARRSACVGAAGTNGAPGATASTLTDDRTAAARRDDRVGKLLRARGRRGVRHSKLPRPPPSRPVAAEGGSAEGGSTEAAPRSSWSTASRRSSASRTASAAGSIRRRSGPAARPPRSWSRPRRSRRAATSSRTSTSSTPPTWRRDRERRASRDRESALQREVEALRARERMEAAARGPRSMRARGARGGQERVARRDGRHRRALDAAELDAAERRRRRWAALPARMAARRGDGEGGGLAEDPHTPSARPVAGVEDGPRRDGGADSPRAAKAVAEGREAVDGAESPQPA